MAHLHERVGEGAVVRSDDIDGNDVLGAAEYQGRVYRFRVRCSNSGRVLSSEIEPASG